MIARWPVLGERYAAAERADFGSQLDPSELTERVRVELRNAFSAGAMWQYDRDGGCRNASTDDAVLAAEHLEDIMLAGGVRTYATDVENTATRFIRGLTLAEYDALLELLDERIRHAARLLGDAQFVGMRARELSRRHVRDGEEAGS